MLNLIVISVFCLFIWSWIYIQNIVYLVNYFISVNLILLLFIQILALLNIKIILKISNLQFIYTCLMFLFLKYYFCYFLPFFALFICLLYYHFFYLLININNGVIFKSNKQIILDFRKYDMYFLEKKRDYLFLLTNLPYAITFLTFYKYFEINLKFSRNYFQFLTLILNKLAGISIFLIKICLFLINLIEMSIISESYIQKYKIFIPLIFLYNLIILFPILLHSELNHFFVYKKILIIDGNIVLNNKDKKVLFEIIAYYNINRNKSLFHPTFFDSKKFIPHNTSSGCLADKSIPGSTFLSAFTSSSSIKLDSVHKIPTKQELGLQKQYSIESVVSNKMIDKNTSKIMMAKQGLTEKSWQIFDVSSRIRQVFVCIADEPILVQTPDHKSIKQLQSLRSEGKLSKYAEKLIIEDLPQDYKFMQDALKLEFPDLEEKYIIPKLKEILSPYMDGDFTSKIEITVDSLIYTKNITGDKDELVLKFKQEFIDFMDK